MGKQSAPPPPDYVGAAQAQGTANVDAARTQGKLSNPSFSNPLGNRTVTFNPDDTVFVKDSLTPQGQQRFDQEQRIISDLGNVAESGVDRVSAGFEKPFDMSGLPSRVNSIMGQPIQSKLDLSSAPVMPEASDATRQRIEQALFERQQPLIDRRRDSTETQLANQGIMRGSEAWKAAQDDLAREENDARLATIGMAGDEMARQFGMGLQARQQGVGEAQTGGAFANTAQAQQFAQALSNAGITNDARQQGIQEQAYLRSLPLNEINALRTGSQVSMPQFQGFNGAQPIQAPNLMGATQAGYDAQVGAVNSKNATQGQTNAALGSMAMMAMMF